MTTEELLTEITWAVRGDDAYTGIAPPAGEFEIVTASFQPDDKECTSFVYEFHFVRKEI